MVLTQRRFMDFGGRSMNLGYASVVEAARTCNALMQLDPLSFADRESYLGLALKVEKVSCLIGQRILSSGIRFLTLAVHLSSRFRPQ